MRTKKRAVASPEPRREPTAAEHAVILVERRGRIVEELKKIIERRDSEVAKMIERLKRNSWSDVAEMYRVGLGLGEACLAEYACEAISHLDEGHEIEEVLQFQLDAIRDRQHQNYHRLGSSSRLSNAVEGERAAAASEYASKCGWWLHDLVTVRALAEVL